MGQNKKGPGTSGSTPSPPHHVPLYYNYPYPPTYAPVFDPRFPVPTMYIPGYQYNFPPGHVTPTMGTNTPPVMPNGFYPHMQQPVFFNGPPHFGPPCYAVGPHFPGPLGSVHNISTGPSSLRALSPPPLVPKEGVPMNSLQIAELKATVVKQIEYYFSDENLMGGDYYFMNLVDEQGWIAISSIAEFNGIKKMNVEIPFILDALEASEAIQVQGEKVKRRNGWSEWILAYATSKTSSVSDTVKKDKLNESNSASSSSNDAKNETKSDSSKDEIEVSSTKESIEDHPPLYLDNLGKRTDCTQTKSKGTNGFGSQFDHVTNIAKQDRKSYKQTLSMEKSMGSYGKRKTHSFPLADENVEDELIKKDNEHPSAAGSYRIRVDEEDYCQVVERLVIVIRKRTEEKPNRPKQNNDEPINARSNSGSRARDDCIEGINNYENVDFATISDSPDLYFYLTPLDSEGPSRLESISSTHGTLSSISISSQSQPFQDPNNELLDEESDFKHQLYKELHDRCLNERKETGIGCSEDMHTLYAFWCYFLRKLFVRSMYSEFYEFALEDSASGYDYGIECLFKFYRYGLEEEFGEDLYKDFEQLTLDLYNKGNLYGLEQYRSFHQRREVDEHREPLKMNPEFERLIRENHRTFGDF